MSHPETARRFVAAELSTRYGSAPDLATLAADKLPMSTWAEARRHDMTPVTIAANHALHVQRAAADLRTVLAYYDAAPDKDSALSAPVWADDDRQPHRTRRQVRLPPDHARRPRPPHAHRPLSRLQLTRGHDHD